MIRTRPSAAGILASLTAFLLPVAFNPAALSGFWSAKTAVLLVTGFAGLPALIGILRSDARRSAHVAIAFLVVATLATLLASTPLAAVVGLYKWSTGLLFLTACVGVWALGASVPMDERPFVTAALLLGAGMSSAIAVLQALDLVEAAALQSGARAWGLSGNAGRLATLAAGVAALGTFCVRSRPVWAALAGGGAFVVQLTGTRSALLVIAAAALVGAIRYGLRPGVLLLAAIGVGTLAGSWVADVGDLATATERSTTVGTSIVTGGPGSNVRLEVWTYAMDAVARRPVLGSGPDRFLAATSRDRTLRVAQLEGANVVYSDAHNIVIEHLVTVGVLGTLALVLWLGLLFRRARGPLSWFAAALLAMAMLQPMDPASTPLLFLALGLAGPVVSAPRSNLPSLALGSVALIAAVALVLGDTQLKRASLDLDLAAARRANVLLRPWPESATVLAELHSFRWQDGEGTVDTALRWRREALRRDPMGPGVLALLAAQERLAGQHRAAKRHYRKALENDPWSILALRGLAEMAYERCDYTEASRYAARALRIGPDKPLQRLLARSRRGSESGICPSAGARDSS